MATSATAASQARLAADIAVYQAIPPGKRTARQNASLATDLATYARQQSALSGGSTTNTPVQLSPPSGAGPVAYSGGLLGPASVGPAEGGGGTGLGTVFGVTPGGSVQPGLIVLGGGILLLLLLLRK